MALLVTLLVMLAAPTWQRNSHAPAFNATKPVTSASGREGGLLRMEQRAQPSLGKGSHGEGAPPVGLVSPWG